MRRFIAIVLSLVALPAVAQTSSLQFHGFLTARGTRVKAQPSWTEGGAGRFDVGAASPDVQRTVSSGVAQLGIDWTPAQWLAFHVDGLARHEPSGTIGSRGGLVQAYVDLYNDHWALRAGSFWLPTSRENVDPLWNSRYTITDSALNSWIGQEVRPLGVDLQYSPNFYVTFGATAFRGNDTMGTELAARGWTFGNRVSVYNEGIALPEDGERTKPFWHDLDGRNGYSGRIRIQLPERALLQLARIDNRTQLAPGYVNGQTPWRTRFDVIGGTLGTNGPTTLAAEWASGRTSVGFPGGSFTMNFETAYLLISRKQGAERWSVRGDRFSTRNHLHRANDGSREHGTAVTVAWLHDVSKQLRAGAEYARVKGDRPGVASGGFDPRTGGSTVTLELRYGF